MFTNDPIRIWSRCVRKWFLFPIHAELLTIIRKRLQDKKFTNSIHFNHYFWLTGEFQKYQIKMANFAHRLGGPTAKCFQLQGGSPPDSLTRGSAPGPHWGLCPQTPVIGSPSALAMSPTRAFCPPQCFRPGDAPEYHTYTPLLSQQWWRNTSRRCTPHTVGLRCGSNSSRRAALSADCGYKPGWCCSHPTISEMTWSVSSGTLNLTIPYHQPSVSNLHCLGSIALVSLIRLALHFVHRHWL